MQSRCPGPKPLTVRSKKGSSKRAISMQMVGWHKESIDSVMQLWKRDIQ